MLGRVHSQIRHAYLRLSVVQCKCKSKKYRVQRDEMDAFAIAARRQRDEVRTQ